MKLIENESESNWFKSVFAERTVPLRGRHKMSCYYYLLQQHRGFIRGRHRSDHQADSVLSLRGCGCVYPTDGLSLRPPSNPRRTAARTWSHLDKVQLSLNFGAQAAMMAGGGFLCLLLMSAFPKALSSADVRPASLIQTRVTVTAAVGQEARFSCLLTESKDVLQVTWQKLLPEGEKNVATCNKYFGQRVNPDFRGKVAITGGGLHNSSLVISSVTGEDEGCYRCLFNAYPEGALSARTCLQLRALHLDAEAQLLQLPRQEPEAGPHADEPAGLGPGEICLIVVCVLLSVGVLAAVTMFLRRHMIRNLKKSRTPQKSDKDFSEQILTPFIKIAADYVTCRSSVKKNPGSGNKPSTATCSRKLFDSS